MQVEIPITGTTGQGRSIKANSGMTTNAYLEVTNTGKPVLTGRHGYETLFTMPLTPIRGVYPEKDYCYWVVGNKLYRHDASYTITELGTLLTVNGAVSISNSGVNLLIVDGFAGYYYVFATGVFAQITDPDFPANPVSSAYTKGYYVVTVSKSQVFHIVKAIDVALGWDGLDYASAEGNPDFTTGVIVYQDEVIFFGAGSIEAWDFTGNADFPIQRNTSVVIDHGCYAPLSVAKVADSVYWLGTDPNGGLFVYRLNGYSAEPVSDHEMIQRISALGYIKDAYAMAFSDDMHSFYVLQFPTESHTEVYDVTSGSWFVWNYSDPVSGELTRWRPTCHAFFNDKHIVGDYANANVYELNKDLYTDDGEVIVHDKVGLVNIDNLDYIRYKSIIFNMETGIGLEDGHDPQIQYRHSDDAGYSWSNWRSVSAGKIGKYRTIPKITGLGAGKQRSIWIRFAEKCKFYLFGVVLDYD